MKLLSEHCPQFLRFDFIAAARRRCNRLRQIMIVIISKDIRSNTNLHPPNLDHRPAPPSGVRSFRAVQCSARAELYALTFWTELARDSLSRSCI